MKCVRQEVGTTRAPDSVAPSGVPSTEWTLLKYLSVRALFRGSRRELDGKSRQRLRADTLSGVGRVRRGFTGWEPLAQHCNDFFYLKMLLKKLTTLL